MTNQLHWGLQNITRITIGINKNFSHKSHHFGFTRQTTFIAKNLGNEGTRKINTIQQKVKYWLHENGN